MREILFRGKRTDNGNFIYGDIHRHATGKMFIKPNKKDCRYSAEVIPETVGQYTGLTDNNGTKIFEGDIHDNIISGKSYLFIVKHGKYYDFEANDKRYGWYFQNTKTNDCNSFYGDEKKYANIIGNIHDNPELLESEVDTE